MGFLEQKIRETSYNGSFQTEYFGKIPIVIMFGNDTNGMVPPYENVWTPVFTMKRRRPYRDVFLNCTDTTLSLSQPKRNTNNQDMILIQQLQKGFLNSRCTERLQNLHLSKIEAVLGTDHVEDIAARGTIITDGHENIMCHNIRRIHKHALPDNPVAFCCCCYKEGAKKSIS